VDQTNQTLEREAAIFESPDDRLLIKRESDADPKFGRLLLTMLQGPDGEEHVATFAKMAALNEIDPRQFPETAGTWPKLRAATRQLVAELPKAIIKHIEGMPLEERLAALQSIQNGDSFPFQKVSLGDLGQWDIIGSIVGAVAGAATSVYNNKLQTDTARQIAKMQLDAQQAQINAQISMANAQQAMANANVAMLPAAVQAPVQAAQQAISTVANALTMDMGGGVPLWMLALGVYLFFKYK
jgi:hypothetical protein